MQECTRDKRRILSSAFAEVVKSFRTKTGKTITQISNEIDLSKTIWADVENAIGDLQFSTFWRIIEALNISHETFISELKKNLPKDFSFSDDFKL